MPADRLFRTRARLGSVYVAAALSGLLYGLSFPSLTQFHLAPLAWICWVPWLLAVRPRVSCGAGALSAYLALALGTAIATHWLLGVAIAVGLFVVLVQSALMLPVPLVFLGLARALGWERALWILPPLWTGWEWLLTLQPLHTPLAFMGYSQSEWSWLVQFADLAGVWGIGFWLILFNVLLAQVWAGTTAGAAGRARHRFVWLAAVAAPMLALPALYGGYRIAALDARLPASPRIVVALMQPSEGYDNDEEEESRHDDVKAIERLVIRSSDAIQAERPDLVIWPESSVSYDMGATPPVRDYLLKVVGRWNVPLILGFPEGAPPAPEYNSALLLTPQLARYASALPEGRSIPLKVYRKQELVPFAERVPYSGAFPTLAEFAPTIGGHRVRLTEGERKAVLFAFLDRSGVKRWAGVRICYEVLYPGGTARLVRRGAQMLAVISNDGLFGRSSETFQIAAYSRLLAISTRRSVARAANTGLTHFVDPAGRIYGAIPWWDERAAVAPVALSNALSPYVRFPDALPVACLGVTAIALLAAAAVAAMSPPPRPA